MLSNLYNDITNRTDDSQMYGILVVIIIATIAGKYYVKCQKQKEAAALGGKNMATVYKNFYRELNSDMDRYKITETDQARINTIVKKIIDEHQNKKELSDYIECIESGVVKGCIFGYLLGSNGITSAVTTAIIYGSVGPIMMYMGY